MSRAFAFRAALAGTLALGALALPTSAAQAQPPAHQLNFNGAVGLYDHPELGGEFLFIDFLRNGSVNGPPDGTVTATQRISGNFSGITPGDVGTITDLTVSTAGVADTPVENFLVLNGYRFTLGGTRAALPGNITFGPISLLGDASGSVASFRIFGTVTGGGFGSSVWNYTGTFTAQFDGLSPEQVFNQINAGQGFNDVSFSANFTAHSVVPEPSTYVLLATGLGVIGLIGLRRRSSTQA